MVAVIHDVLKQGPYSDWNELHEQISQIAEAENETRKGDAFEQFCYFYLEYHKTIYEIEEIWCDKVPGRAIPDSFKDQEGKYRIGAGKKIDMGTDLVAQLKNKGFNERHEAYQAKFRNPISAHPPSDELESFWIDSQNFESQRIMTSTTTLAAKDRSKTYHPKSKDHIYRGDFLNISNPEDFFAKLYVWANDQEKVPERTLYEPRDYQEEMIKDVVDGFNNLKKKKDQRGKLIAACGTGKTLAALWITEHSDLDISNLLFLAPTIELTAQTFREWAMQHKKEFDFLIICSDDDAGNVGEDNSDIPVSDVGIRVTTDPLEIVEFLNMESDKRKYVFSTYQSSDRIRHAMELTTTFKSFDLIIFDEAHRTASNKMEIKGGMQVAIDNSKINSKRRLFMTATERIQTPRIKRKLESENQDYFSMDDEDKYGTTFHSLTFGKAIKQKIIADYRIILASCNYNDSDVDALYNAAEISGISEKEWPLTVLEAYQALFISKLLLEDKISKTLTFQNSVARAQAFALLLQQIVPSEISCDSIWGAEGIANRREKKSQFSLAEKAVLSNVRCLSEGVDLPMIDSVVFCDDRSSPIDLIQAVGRALRKKEGEDKIASILIPMPIPSEVETLDDIDWDNVPGMTTFHYVLQALRDQDETLNHKIDDIIFQGQRGKTPSRPKSGGKIDHVMILPEKMKIDLHDMWGKIVFRISDANFRKEGEKSIFGELGKIKGDRKSKHKTKFPLFADYNVQKGMKDECLEVIAQLSDDKKPISRSTLGEYASSNGNNTASMLVSIGAVEETEGNKVMITSLGLGLKAHPEQWNDVVINQALIFFKNQLHPYRLILTVLVKYGRLNYHEYLLGISQIEFIGRKPNIVQMTKTISYLRNNYPPGLSRIPDNKHDVIIAELESNGIEVNVEKKDIWSAATTQKNKWGNLKSCLELFPCIIIDKDWIKVKDGKENELKLLLLNSKPAMAKTYGTSSSFWHPSLLKADDANDDDDDFELL